MKFLDWLLGRKKAPAPKSKSRAELARELEPGLNALFGPLMMPVPKWTHAGKKGKTIYCPHCKSSTHVYNFAWSALVCPSCKAEVNKYLWLISKDV
jgi:hypothetical protein